MSNPNALPPNLEAVLRAVDAEQPARLSTIMTATGLLQYHAMQTVEHLVRITLIRPVPPGARYALTAEGTARLSVPRTASEDKSSQPENGPS